MIAWHIVITVVSTLGALGPTSRQSWTLSADKCGGWHQCGTWLDYNALYGSYACNPIYWQWTAIWALTKASSNEKCTQPICGQTMSICRKMRVVLVTTMCMSRLCRRPFYTGHQGINSSALMGIDEKPHFLPKHWEYGVCWFMDFNDIVIYLTTIIS